VADSVADLRALLAELDIAGPVHLVGNSFGGTVAVEFALRYPELVASMTLIEAHVPLAGWSERMRETFDDVTRSLRDPAVRARIDAENSRSLTRLAERADQLIGGTSLPSDLIATPPMALDRLRGIRCPVLAIYGEHSDVAEYGAALADVVPRCVHRVVPDHDHSLLMNGTRDVLSLLMSWLAEHAPAVPVPHQRRSSSAARVSPFRLADAR
jgi:pimeloyl-ACP methyl ester carboxylesterase